MKPCDIGSEAAERYVAGSMPEPERTSFEDHFFACDDCFHSVQALATARSVLADGTFTHGREKAGGSLRGSTRGLPLQWMAAAAALIVVVGLSVLVRPGSSPEQVHPAVVAEAPVAAPPAAGSTSPAASSISRFEHAGSTRAADTRWSRQCGQARAMGPRRSSAVCGADDAIGSGPGRRRKLAEIRRGDGPLLGRPLPGGRRGLQVLADQHATRGATWTSSSASRN